MTGYRTANLAWQLGDDAQLIRDLADGVDVLALVECRTRDDRPVDVAKALGHEWIVQQDLRSGARAGSATAVRRDSGVTVRSSKLRKLSEPGHHVQTRYMRVTTVVDPHAAGGRGAITEVNAAHLALETTGRQEQGEETVCGWMRDAEARVARQERRRRSRLLPKAVRRRIRVRRWLWCGDANQSPDSWRRRTDAPHAYGQSPMSMLWGPGWRGAALFKRPRPHTDHYVLTLHDH